LPGSLLGHGGRDHHQGGILAGGDFFQPLLAQGAAHQFQGPGQRADRGQVIARIARASQSHHQAQAHQLVLFLPFDAADVPQPGLRPGRGKPAQQHGNQQQRQQGAFHGGLLAE